MKQILLAVLFTMLSAQYLHSQAIEIRGIGSVRAKTEPAEPAFAEPFEILLTLRLRRGVDVFLPDTLSPAPAMESYAPGSWRIAPAPGDSLEVSARYPAIGYREGTVELPRLDMWVAIAADGIGAVRSARNDVLPPDALRSIDLGTVQVGRYTAIMDSAEVAPRPSAGVLGNRWNPWLLLAIGLTSMAGVGGIGMLASRWRERLASAFGSQRRVAPRDDALRELEQLLSLGWHLDGKVDEFYARSTDILREYASQLDEAWPTSLTSTELVAKLEQGLGPEKVTGLASSIEVAERVKFGDHYPPSLTPEADWQRIHAWIRSTPGRS